MQNAKESVLTVINNLPDNASYDDIMEALYVNQKIDKGIEQLDIGDSISIEELRKRMKKWLE